MYQSFSDLLICKNNTICKCNILNLCYSLQKRLQRWR